jgi:hypothetical protein
MEFATLLPVKLSAPDPPARFSKVEIVSVPAPPVFCAVVVARLTVSAAVTPAYVSVSVPSPPVMVSFAVPVPPLIVSFPAPPLMVSTPLPPVRMSFPASPLMVMAVAKDPPLTVSLPSPAFTVNASTDPEASVMSVPPPSEMLVADAKLIASAPPDPTIVSLSVPPPRSMLKSLLDVNAPPDKAITKVSLPVLPFTSIRFVFVTSALPHCAAPASVVSLSKMISSGVGAVFTPMTAEFPGSIVTVAVVPAKVHCVTALAAGAKNSMIGSRENAMTKSEASRLAAIADHLFVHRPNIPPPSFTRRSWSRGASPRGQNGDQRSTPPSSPATEVNGSQARRLPSEVTCRPSRRVRDVSVCCNRSMRPSVTSSAVTTQPCYPRA